MIYELIKIGEKDIMDLIKDDGFQDNMNELIKYLFERKCREIIINTLRKIHEEEEKKMTEKDFLMLDDIKDYEWRNAESEFRIYMKHLLEDYSDRFRNFCDYLFRHICISDFLIDRGEDIDKVGEFCDSDVGIDIPKKCYYCLLKYLGGDFNE